MKYFGATNFVFSMEIKRDRANMKLYLNRKKYVETILQRSNMQECKPIKFPSPIGVELFVN
jgi:hypothetical protein